MEMNVQALYAAGLSKNLTSRPIVTSSVNASGKAFGNILAEKEKEAGQVKFSKHASLRMSDRGLEMSDEQLWDTTMNPEKRRLRQITIDNAAEAERTFSMLMGEDVPPRRQFIEENAHYANIDA